MQLINLCDITKKNIAALEFVWYIDADIRTEIVPVITNISN